MKQVLFTLMEFLFLSHIGLCSLHEFSWTLIEQSAMEIFKKIKSTCDISNIYMSIFLSKNPHTHKIKFKDLHTGTLCIIYGGLLYQISSAMYWYNRESWSLTFTSECWFIGHGLGADITGRGVTKADTHKMVSMTTFVLFLFVLK